MECLCILPLSYAEILCWGRGVLSRLKRIFMSRMNAFIMRPQMTMLGETVHYSLTHVLTQGFSLNLELGWRTATSSNFWISISFAILKLRSWWPCSNFKWVRGIWTQVFMHNSNHWVISPVCTSGIWMYYYYRKKAEISLGLVHVGFHSLSAAVLPGLPFVALFCGYFPLDTVRLTNDYLLSGLEGHLSMFYWVQAFNWEVCSYLDGFSCMSPQFLSYCFNIQ